MQTPNEQMDAEIERITDLAYGREADLLISDVAWGELLRQLEYKQTWKGGQFVKVDRYFPSSKTCSSCLKVSDSLPLSVRKWRCQYCGTEHDRDVNAAQNILKQAEVQLGVKGTESRRKPMVTGSMKRGQVLPDADTERGDLLQPPTSLQGKSDADSLHKEKTK